MGIGVVLLVGMGLIVGAGAWLAWHSTYADGRRYDDTPSWRYTNTQAGGESDRVGGFLGGLWPWQMDRAGELADRWARDNDYRIVASEYRFWREGPFWWRSTDSQIVQRITVKDRYGNERSGYMRSGHWLFGLWNDNVDVEWDEPPQTIRWRR